MKKKVLALKSSVFGEMGNSSKLLDKFLKQLQEQELEWEVKVRNLTDEPIPHLDGRTTQAFFTASEERNEEQKQAVALSDNLIEELKSSALLVIGLPMYNFGVPSTLKAWIDHVARAGITFQYTENGPQGLLKDTKAVILATRGGAYKDTALDSQTTFIKTFLNFIGIEDIEFIYLENLATSSGEAANTLWQTAQAQIESTVANV